MDAAPDCRSVVPGLQARPASLLLDSKAASSPGSASSPKPSSTTQSCTRRRPVVFSATSRVPTASSTAVALRAASQRFLDLIDDLDALLWCRYRADPRVATGVPSSRSSQLASRRPVEWPVPDGPALARHLGLHRPRSSAWGCSSSRWRTAPAARVPIVVMPAQRRGFSQADPGQEEKTDEHAAIVGDPLIRDELHHLLATVDRRHTPLPTRTPCAASSSSTSAARTVSSPTIRRRLDHLAVPRAMRRLLHRPLDHEPDSRHAARQAGRRPLRPARRRRPLPPLRRPRAPRVLRGPQPFRRDVRRQPGGGDGLPRSPRASHPPTAKLDVGRASSRRRFVFARLTPRRGEDGRGPRVA